MKASNESKVNFISDINDHLVSFAKAFIVKNKIERWTDLLSRRPKRIFSKSSGIFNHLDMNYAVQHDSMQNVADQNIMGVFFDFINDPSIVTFKEAITLGDYRDAIFSIKPGKFAIFFFHEGWNFVCKRQ